MDRRAVGCAAATPRVAYPTRMAPVHTLTVHERTVLLDAVLRPHRSLGPAGFRLLMGTVAAFCLTIGIVFAALGAWPVFAFLGLDVLLVFLAFRWSYRSARECERIRLDTEALEIVHTGADGRARSWTFQPHWLRIDFNDSGDHTDQLRLSSHGHSLVIGAFLAPEERARCAQLLRDGIQRWRALPPGIVSPT